MATSISIQNINEVEVHTSVIGAAASHDNTQREWLKLTLRTGNVETTIDLLLEDLQLAALRNLRDDLSFALATILSARRTEACRLARENNTLCA